MTKLVVPSVFATKEKEYIKRFTIIKEISRRIHLDIMDGEFVSNKSPPLNYFYGKGNYNEIDAHLMVKNPEKYIDEMKKIGVKRVYIHIESGKTSDLIDTIGNFKKEGFIVCVAINPETPTDSLIPFVFHADGCLVMAVHPGKEGQAFISGTYNKLRDVFKHMRGKEIAIDGGIRSDVAIKLRDYGVDVLVSGSSIGLSTNPKKAFEELKRVFL